MKNIILVHEKVQYGHRLLGHVWVGIQRVGNYIYAPSTFTAHKSKGQCAHNEKERKIMYYEKNYVSAALYMLK